MHRPAAVLLAILAAGCAEVPKSPHYVERVVLLPSADGRASAVVVKRETAEHMLAHPYQAVELAEGAERQFAMSEADAQNRYGELLAMQPARPLTLTLFFNFGTAELTPESRVLLAQVEERIASFPAAEVLVVGHTDTMGAPELNDALSLKRAAAVREILIHVGIDPAVIEIVGRGSRELLIPTAPWVREERNRRVEVKLR